MATRIQIRRDTLANWNLFNPILANGEISYVTDTAFIKVGDGSTHWTSLPYATMTGNVSAGTVNATINVISPLFTYPNGVNILDSVGAYYVWANANAASQTTSINSINANIGAYYTWANANAASQATSIVNLQSNTGSYYTWANANLGVQAASITTLFANATAQDANLGQVTTNLNTLTANVGAYETVVNANLITQQGNFNTLTANVGILYSGNIATQANIGTLVANTIAQQGQINTLTANVGAYETWANATFSVSSYSNSNVGGYLTTYGGNIAAGNVTVTGNLYVVGNLTVTNTEIVNTTEYVATLNATNVYATTIGNASSQGTFGNITTTNGLFWANGVNALAPSYGNTQVSAYLPTYSGALSNSSDVIALYSNAATQATAINTITANIGAYETYANANAVAQASAITTLDANLGVLYTGNITTNANIGAVYANLSTQTTNYNTLTANVGVLYANAAAQATALTTLDANVGILYTSNITTNANIGLVYANLAAQQGNYNTLNANVGAYETWANANLANQTTGINSLNANLGTTQANIGVVYANLVAQQGNFNTLNANVGAYEAAVNANLVTQQGNFNTLTANVGVLYSGNITTQANIGVLYANAITQQGQIASLVATANANTAAYLTTYNGTIGGDITIGGNLSVIGNTVFRNSEIVTGTEVVAGNLVANSGATSTSTTTGALVVTGGTGISGSLNVGGNTSLGSVSNVSIAGGASGYTLTTTGTGVLSFTAANAHVLGANSTGAFATNAVTLTSTTNVADGLALLNSVLGKLVPASPPTFPGATALTLTAPAGTTGLITNFVQTNNSIGNTYQATAGTSVTTYRATTYTTSTLTSIGPGDQGTVRVFLNNVVVGSNTLVGGTGGNVIGNLTIALNQDYHNVVSTVAAGFWYSFNATASGATGAAPSGWNTVLINDTYTNSNTNPILWYVDTSAPGTPAFSNTSISLVTNTVAYSSTIPHFTTGSNFRLKGNVNNLSGDTYPTGGVNLTSATAAGGAFAAPTTITYAQASVTTPLTRNLYVGSGSAYFETPVATVTTGFGNSLGTVGPTISVNNNYNTGTTSGGAGTGFAPGVTILYKTGTATAIEETSIPFTTSVGSGTGARIILTASTDTPTYTGTESLWASATTPLAANDSTVVGWGAAGAIRCDQTNYSTGFLPVGPNLTTQSATQYFTFRFIQNSLAKFNVLYTGNIAGLWVAAPGTTIDTTSTLSGWLTMGTAYQGAGVPGAGAGGNGSNGCTVGTLPTFNAQATGNINATFGTVSTANSANHYVYVRLKLTAGQTVTALSIQPSTS